MNAADKPAPGPIAQQWARARPVDERKGWVFHHITMTASRWTIQTRSLILCPDPPKKIP